MSGHHPWSSIKRKGKTVPKDPLWLPKGSVRALITFSLVAIVATTVFVPHVAGAATGTMVTLMALAVRDYFVSRNGE